ncbi:hypothetical protein MJH12_13335 [bacterium]|nr:hypothetical protein [bacterium]
MINEEENLDQQLASKNIIWIGKETTFGNTVCQWTFKWMTQQGIRIDTIARTSGLELAIKSLEAPLKTGTAPDMIIIDRSLESVGIESFSTIVSDCIPECWVVELVTSKDPIQPDGSVIYLQKPFKKSDWLDLLNHCFVECPNPQWSKSYS